MKNIKKKIVGYSNKISVRPQEKISFMISCDKKIKSIYSKFVKIIQGDCNPEGPGYKEELVNSYNVIFQPFSYVLIHIDYVLSILLITH